ncbi:MAG: inositol monophosphatase family protein, partial [Salibacteraceae bacterium]
MNYQAICESSISIIKETGKYILSQRKGFTEDAVETKSLNSLVSFVDKTAEIQLVKQLGELIPEAGFIAEEGTSTKIGKEYNWVIDPLDGTTNFIHGIPLYSISVALTKNGFPVIGIVYEINLDECFYAWKDSKAYLNGSEISVTKTSKMSDTLLATGFPYHDFDKMDGFLKSLRYFMEHTRGLRRLGSAAVDLAYVACGRVDGFYEYGLNPWDVVAGAFIVEQAGGKSGFFT